MDLNFSRILQGQNGGRHHLDTVILVRKKKYKILIFINFYDLEKFHISFDILPSLLPI